MWLIIIINYYFSSYVFDVVDAVASTFPPSESSKALYLQSQIPSKRGALLLLHTLFLHMVLEARICFTIPRYP